MTLERAVSVSSKPDGLGDKAALPGHSWKSKFALQLVIYPVYSNSHVG
jgi:hypothetical protein